MFNYFYKNTTSKYTFSKLPDMLFKDIRFKNLHGDSKILYSLLLKRSELSAKNEWYDNDGKIYIIYTIEQIMNDLNCWNQKAIKCIKELVKMGLVITKRQGQGKPNLTYVMDFSDTSLKYDLAHKKKSNELNDSNATHNPKVLESHLQKCDSNTSRNVKIESQEMRKSHPSNIDNLSNRDTNNICLEKELNNNNIYIKDIISNPILSYHDDQDYHNNQERESTKLRTNEILSLPNIKKYINTSGEEDLSTSIKNVKLRIKTLLSLPNITNIIKINNKSHTLLESNDGENVNTKVTHMERVNQFARNSKILSELKEYEQQIKISLSDFLRENSSIKQGEIKRREVINESTQMTQYNYSVQKNIEKPNSYEVPKPISYGKYESTVMENISYTLLCESYKYRVDLIKEIVNVITLTLCTNFKDGHISMGNERIPEQIVKDIYLKLNKDHIEYFIECYDKQSEPIKKLIPYIRKSLYCNFTTIDHYYQNAVRVDMQ